MSFCHLHVHTEYSLLDGLSKIPDIAKKVAKMGQKAVAITDHGNCYGLPEFYAACQKNDVKPILGCEVYVAPGDRRDKEARTPLGKAYYHLILLVKNEEGYRNLCRLVTRSNTEGYYYKPRVDRELLEKFHDGLICLSACVAGEVAQFVLAGDEAKAEETALWYREIFGEDYYLEIQNHGLASEETAYDGVIRIARKHGIPLVCTNDSHYVNSDDEEAHDWLLAMQQGKPISESTLHYEGDYSLKSEEEMRSLYPGLPDAFDNTEVIADKVTFEFEYGKYRMPKVSIPEEYGTDYMGYMAHIAWEGFAERYPASYARREEAKARLESELAVIQNIKKVRGMDFSEYFLDTWTTVSWAKKNDIPVGPGRGSAAGSILCYCLKITDIDPVPYDLLFERFLNPERVSMPDIDVDYCYSDKERVVAFEANRCGLDEDGHPDHFSKIRTVMRLQAKAVIKAVCKTAGLPTAVGNEFAKFVPEEPGMTLEKAYADSQELRDYVVSSPELSKVWTIALKLEGTAKTTSTHACGHIPTPVPCEDLYPCSVDKDGLLICQYDMVEAEHLGNLKKDLLMLRNLSVIKVAHAEILRRYGITVPYWTEEIISDAAALALIAEGNTKGVFQLESPGMQGFMKQLLPSCFEDIIAGLALYRPGPMDYIPNYIAGKKDVANIHYLTPQLEPILAPTYGTIVYQEQVMLIVRSLAGYSMPRADILRKSMGKKLQAIMDAERLVFVNGNAEEIAQAKAKGEPLPAEVPGCVKNGISAEIANAIYDQMADFAKYAFNKSHAAGYAEIAMQTAYLKAHYQKEFFAGLLSSVMDDTDHLGLYIEDAKAAGCSVLIPDLNTSEETFTVNDDGALVYGLGALKGVGEEAVRQIVSERKAHGEYKSFTDFMNRLPDVANKKVCEALIYSGAFNFTGLNKKTLLGGFKILKVAKASAKKAAKKNVEGQISIMDFLGEEEEDVRDNFPILEEMPYKDLTDGEMSALGLNLSYNPLGDLTKYIAVNSNTSAKQLSELPNDIPVEMVGYVKDLHVVYTKKTGEPMAMVTMQDIESGEFKATVFPKLYAEVKASLKEGARLWVTGKTSEYNEKIGVNVDRLVNLDMVDKEVWLKATDLHIAEEAKAMLAAKGLSGGKGLYVFLGAGKKPGMIVNAYREPEEAYEALCEVYSKENVVMRIPTARNVRTARK